MATYIVVRQSPRYHQMSMDELLFGSFTAPAPEPNYDDSGTKTYKVENVSEHFSNMVYVDGLIRKLHLFNESTAELREVPREKLYHTFHIPKKSGSGLRRIDAPNDELKDALRRLKTIFEENFRALYHTSAFAYVRGRSTVDAVKRHQLNQSRWFGKFDLHDFFGSTTLDWIMQQFGMVFPFSEVVKVEQGAAELRAALELAIYNGGLPQGTPVSPTITNIMMIPIDFELANAFRKMEFDRKGVMAREGAEEDTPLTQRLVYTRYADDFIISSRYNYDIRQVQDFLLETLKKFGAPFSLNTKKTRYGSSAGSNWNLGVMLNKDNEITVGHKRKQQFQHMIHNYILDRRNGNPWDPSDIMTLKGYYDYYRMVEPEAIKNIVDHMNKKLGADLLSCIKEDLHP